MTDQSDGDPRYYGDTVDTQMAGLCSTKQPVPHDAEQATKRNTDPDCLACILDDKSKGMA
jgi:hypothetical protein